MAAQNYDWWVLAKLARLTDKLGRLSTDRRAEAGIWLNIRLVEGLRLGTREREGEAGRVLTLVLELERRGDHGRRCGLGGADSLSLRELM